MCDVMADLSYGGLKEDAVQFAQRAVKCDKEGLVDTAAFFYQASLLATISSQRWISHKKNLSLSKLIHYF